MRLRYITRILHKGIKKGCSYSITNVHTVTPVTSFADIKECLLSAPCDINANCMNTIGSYTCECKDGFTGDGYMEGGCIGRRQL